MSYHWLVERNDFSAPDPSTGEPFMEQLRVKLGFEPSGLDVFLFEVVSQPLYSVQSRARFSIMMNPAGDLVDQVSDLCLDDALTVDQFFGLLSQADTTQVPSSIKSVLSSTRSRLQCTGSSQNAHLTIYHVVLTPETKADLARTRAHPKHQKFRDAQLALIRRIMAMNSERIVGRLASCN